jgi:outer membrane protein OmpA-like peptidoglycan-associated protein
VLDEAVAVMREETALKVVAIGHSDSGGSAAYNRHLSLRRAEAVRRYLIERGVEPSRLDVEGRGESQPVATNDTEEERAQNRRVELKVVAE